MIQTSAISVDLDSLPHYTRIQGLSETLLDERARGLVASTAIPRFLELFEKAGVKATFFAIGEDVKLPGMADALRESHRAGVEIASHSHSHDYALSRRELPEIEADLRAADHAILETVGERPVGFRAPGYTLSPALLQAVAALGYQYDSSTFPATPYYLAKAGVMGALAALGRPSRAILDTPRVLFAPRGPYRPDLLAPYTIGSAPLIELPMAVAPLTRLPFIGTFATSLPWPLVRATYASFAREPFFNFELHALDVLDAQDGIPPELSRQQRDLNVPVKTKLERLSTLLKKLGTERESLTLSEVSKRMAADL